MTYMMLFFVKITPCSGNVGVPSLKLAIEVEQCIAIDSDAIAAKFCFSLS